MNKETKAAIEARKILARYQVEVQTKALRRIIELGADNPSLVQRAAEIRFCILRSGNPVMPAAVRALWAEVY